MVVRAQQSPWRVSTSDDGTVLAALAMDHPEVLGATILTVMTIGFEPQAGCHAEVGVAVLKGREFGSPVGRISPPRTEPVSLTVDGSLIPTPAPFLVKYDNGWEAIFLADRKIFQALITGRTATVQIVSGTPKFEFPIAGAAVAVSAAQQQCMSSR